MNDVYNLSEITISNVKGSDFCCIISLISINEAINLLQNADLTKKIGNYKVKKYKNFARVHKNGKNNNKIW